eukprot:TRINITY_DN31931_c0_g1_i1.p3 TRINITY_DN31931_c0_g1~~TRINITY_DN31931_c0_g1_i1.p3  ORF type:complete len:296 (+),score=100.32 TRINITY_DN31931_c0_g1_i1:1364-2251(+)
MVTPPLAGVLAQRGRVFPYTSLTCMSAWQSVPGCIVGATNPMFQSRPEWWDVLCDLDTGRVLLSPAGDVAQALSDPSALALDQAFMQRLFANVQQQERADTPPAEVEAWVRHQFRDHLQNLLLLARDGAAGDPEKQAAADAQAQRLARWRKTVCYQDWAEAQARSEARRQVNIEGHLRRLRGSRELDEEASILIFQDFVKHLRSEEQLLSLLAALPVAAGGLYPVALGLFHRSGAVRMACVALLRRIDAIPEGRLCISALNAFMMLAYERGADLMPATDAVPFADSAPVTPVVVS